MMTLREPGAAIAVLALEVEPSSFACEASRLLAYRLLLYLHDCTVAFARLVRPCQYNAFRSLSGKHSARRVKPVTAGDCVFDGRRH